MVLLLQQIGLRLQSLHTDMWLSCTPKGVKAITTPRRLIPNTQ
jgi:hypothetical protein